MKLPLLISGCTHLVLIGVIVILSRDSYLSPVKSPAPDIRWVTLVTPPREAAATNTATVAVPPPAAIKVAPKTKPTEAKAKIESPALPPTPALSPVAEEAEGLPDVPVISDVRVDNPNFKFIYYLNLIRLKVQENWQPPRTKTQSLPKAMVRFNINRYGNISQVLLEQTSGNLLFDQSTQRAVENIRRFPPLPEEFEDDELVVHLEFEGLP